MSYQCRYGRTAMPKRSMILWCLLNASDVTSGIILTGFLVTLVLAQQETVQRYILLRHLALELDRIVAVFGHGLSPRKPGRDSPILAPSPGPSPGVQFSRG